MTQPQQPKDPPPQGAPSDADPAGQTPLGIPKGVENFEPKGRPTSDREQTETAVKK